MSKAGKAQEAKRVSVIVLDLAAVIHFVKPKREIIVGEFTTLHLLSFIQSKITEHTTRVDAVWDIFKDESLKSQTRINCGQLFQFLSKELQNATADAVYLLI